MPKRELLKLSPAEVENRAITYVLEHEIAAKREPRDARKKAGSLVDVESYDPVSRQTRMIEVKAFGGSGRGEFLWVEENQVSALKDHPDAHLYIVTFIRSSDPSDIRLLDLTGPELQKRLELAKPKRYYEVPMPVAVYDALLEGAESRVDSGD